VAGAGESVARNDTVRAEALGDWTVLDIRQDDEFADGHIPGALHRELGTLAGDAASLPRSRWR
jgi:rhodanese-related sulfurtransferase